MYVQTGGRPKRLDDTPKTRTAYEQRTKALRKEGGRYLKDLRNQVGMTQRELATQLGLAYHTTISQMEVGMMRPPPDMYVALAEVFGLSRREFVKTLLRYYDPLTFDALFKGTPDEDGAMAIPHRE